MGPPPRVRPRKDAGEGDGALGVSLLNVARVCLVRHTQGVERVPTVDVTGPQVDRRAGQRRRAVSGVEDGEPDGQRHAAGDARRGTEAAGEVAAHDAALAKDVDTV